MTSAELLAKWRCRAEVFRSCAARVDGATTCDEFVADLLGLDVESLDELLTMDRAVTESGYSAAQLRRLGREGKLIAIGHGSAWRISRRNLPRKPCAVAPRTGKLHVEGAKAEQVVRESVGASNGTPR